MKSPNWVYLRLSFRISVRSEVCKKGMSHACDSKFNRKVKIGIVEGDDDKKWIWMPKLHFSSFDLLLYFGGTISPRIGWFFRVPSVTENSEKFITLDRKRNQCSDIFENLKKKKHIRSSIFMRSPLGLQTFFVLVYTFSVNDRGFRKRPLTGSVPIKVKVLCVVGVIIVAFSWDKIRRVEWTYTP